MMLPDSPDDIVACHLSLALQLWTGLAFLMWMRQHFHRLVEFCTLPFQVTCEPHISVFAERFMLRVLRL